MSSGLEEAVEHLAGVPLDVRRFLDLIRELDRRWRERMGAVSRAQAAFLKKVRARAAAKAAAAAAVAAAGAVGATTPSIAADAASANSAATAGTASGAALAGDAASADARELEAIAALRAEAAQLATEKFQVAEQAYALLRGRLVRVHRDFLDYRRALQREGAVLAPELMSDPLAVYGLAGTTPLELATGGDANSGAWAPPRSARSGDGRSDFVTGDELDDFGGAGDEGWRGGSRAGAAAVGAAAAGGRQAGSATAGGSSGLGGGARSGGSFLSPLATQQAAAAANAATAAARARRPANDLPAHAQSMAGFAGIGRSSLPAGSAAHEAAASYAQRLARGSGGGQGSAGAAGGGGGGGYYAADPYALPADAAAAAAAAVEDTTPYCTCRRPTFGEMIACDSSTCEFEWCALRVRACSSGPPPPPLCAVHLDCVGLTEAPEGCVIVVDIRCGERQ